jgi:hypothetical protein
MVKKEVEAILKPRADCGVYSGVLTYTASKDGGLAVSGSNVYAAWNCMSDVLFAGSHDGGKTFANTLLRSGALTPNPKIVNYNVTISATGNNVAIMWDSNKTGIINPEIRTSNDGGKTFGNVVTLNSTAGGINK